MTTLDRGSRWMIDPDLRQRCAFVQDFGGFNSAKAKSSTVATAVARLRLLVRVRSLLGSLNHYLSYEELR